jgi:hypothetical protein
MKKNRVFIRIILILIVITLAGAGVYIFQETRYAKVIEVKDGIVTGLQEEVVALQNIPKKSVIVFNKDSHEGKEITEDDLMTLLIEESIVPTNAVTKKDDVIGKRLKIKSSQYQYITNDLIYLDTDIPDDLREKEYTYLVVPEKLYSGDTVDVRIKFPSGQDYIVLSKKLVTDLDRQYNENNELTKETVWINQEEDETVRMGSAIVDAYLNKATLYMIEYVEPYVQEAATVTYPKNFPVLDMISSNPNLLDIAEKELENREKLEQSITDMYKDTKIDFTTPNIVIPEDEIIQETQILNEETTTEENAFD